MHIIFGECSGTANGDARLLVHGEGMQLLLLSEVIEGFLWRLAINRQENCNRIFAPKPTSSKPKVKGVQKCLLTDCQTLTRG